MGYKNVIDTKSWFLEKSWEKQNQSFWYTLILPNNKAYRYHSPNDDHFIVLGCWWTLLVMIILLNTKLKICWWLVMKMICVHKLENHYWWFWWISFCHSISVVGTTGGDNVGPSCKLASKGRRILAMDGCCCWWWW